MPRLLLLMTTTTYRASAFLDAARRLQVTVVVGSDQAQALEALTPGSTLTLDFFHPEAAARTIAAFAAAYPLDAVVAARNKHQMRHLLAAGDVPTPRFACYSIDDDAVEVARQLTFPCVLKPL